MEEESPLALMGSNNNGDENGGGSDSEEEDDLADIPDTREYMPIDVEGLQSIGIGRGSGGLAMPSGGYGGEDGDGRYTMADLKNMTKNNHEFLDEDVDDEDDEDDANDVQLHDGDALLVVAKTEEDYASLEINVFDTLSSNLYVHHDIPLPAFPLCFALGSVVAAYDGRDAMAGNYVAVGSFDPAIEIWNLDVMNALEPTVVLGGADTSGTEDRWMRLLGAPASTAIGNHGASGKKKQKKKRKSGMPLQSDACLRDGSHSDAVMGLSWNAVHVQVLASGSADGTVKLWDVTHSGGSYVRPSSTLTHHADKVQSLAWHPSEGTLLATGGYDHRVCLVDARAASQSNVKKAKLMADCEAIAWDPHNPQYLTVASEDGVVKCLDVRKFASEPVWSMVAHEYGGVSDICYNSKVPGMLVTCSIDKTVALWDIVTPNDTPQSCGSKDMNVGKLYSVSCYPSAPWLLACGGSGNELAIWDMEREDAIRKRFASRHINEGDVSAGAVSSGSDGGQRGQATDFEAAMAVGEGVAVSKALEGMKKSKRKKGKKKSKAHKRK